MLVVDLNLYAINRDAALHEPAREWWDEILPNPLTVDQSLAAVEDWLQQAPVRVLEPTERHWPILRSLLEASGSAGNLTSDAHLAALAIEHGAVLCSADRDFGRFEHLRWHNPLDP